MKVALVYDELSPACCRTWVEAEYESPETIAALLAAIEANGHAAVPIPFGPSLMAELEREAPDLVFNIAEGREGPSRESIVPALLDHLGISYTGSDTVALGVSLNKALTKRLVAGAGISTPPFRLFRSPDEVAEGMDGLRFPVLVKPNFGGSSVGVGAASIVHDPGSLRRLVADQLAHYEQPCLAEAYVKGVDVTVGLLGNGEVVTFPAGCVATAEGMYSAEVKRKHDREVICPSSLPDGLEERLADRSRTVFRLIGARDFARVDYMLDAHGSAHFLEINPLPGLSPYYGVFPVLAEAAGYSHTQLIGAIIEQALSRTTHTRSRLHERLAR